MLLYLNYPFIFVAEKNLTKNIKMTQFEKKYLDNSNKRLASQYKPKQKVRFKESVHEAN